MGMHLNGNVLHNDLNCFLRILLIQACVINELMVDF